MSEPKETSNEDRRQFIKGTTCVIGCAIGLVPTLASVRVVLDPIGRERVGGAGFTRLAHFDELQPGKPTMVPVVAEKRDKWSISESVVGAVWLVREKLDNASANPEGARTPPTKPPDAANPVEKGAPLDATAMKSLPHVTAFSSICPHLGCFVDFREKEDDFYCPCHNSKFKLTGKPMNDTPPRRMDELEIDTDTLRDTGEVWVKYERFKTNTSEKLPA